MFDKIIDYFIGPPIYIPTKEDRLNQIKKNVRTTVASVASGNVLLMRGIYQTREDLEKLREENLKYFNSKTFKRSR